MINKKFWSLGSATLQRGFLLKQVKQVPKARERKGSKGSREKKEAHGSNEADGEAGVRKERQERNRMFTRKYTFTINGEGSTGLCTVFLEDPEHR